MEFPCSVTDVRTIPGLRHPGKLPLLPGWIRSAT
jgi:hypothetical protein